MPSTYNCITKLHNLLLKKHLTISTAESCTGGLLASTLTDKPGASEYFKGGIIAYSNEVKHEVLEVQKGVLDKFGAVSKETAALMAVGCQRLFKTDIACAITGILGPSGGTIQKPVGTVFISILYNEKVNIAKFEFTGNRKQNKKWAVEYAISLILSTIDP